MRRFCRLRITAPGFRGHGVDMAEHIPHVCTGEFRLFKSMALRVDGPLMGLMGTVPDDHKISPVAVTMQRFKPHVIIERAGQRAVVLEPDIVVVQDIGVGDPHDHLAQLLEPSGQRVILTEYYDEDLSLAEIAENLGITRQGVRDAIKHGEAALDELEQKLGNARRHTRMQADLDRLRLLVTEIRCSNSGSFTPDSRITNDTAEMLTILHRLDTQEDADGL